MPNPLQERRDSTEDEQPAPTASSPVGEADMTLGGLKLGITFAEAEERLGSLKKNQGPWGDYWTAEGSDGTLHLYKTNGIVVELFTFDLASPRGLAIGDPLTRIKELYGEPSYINRKYGEWVYEGPRPFKVAVIVREDRVHGIRAYNFGLTEPKPDPGREVIVTTPVPPLSPADFVLAGIPTCWIIPEIKDYEQLVRHPKSDVCVPIYTTEDGLVELRADPGGLNTCSPERLYRTAVKGKEYPTQRDVRVGDPDSRVEALYGAATAHSPGVETTFTYKSGDLTLTFTANLNGRITAIESSCYHDHKKDR